MAYSARSLSTNLLQNNISQIAHGFTVGQVLIFNGATWVLAQANSATNANTIGMVSYVIDANTFSITQVGYISQLSYMVVPGQQYYLSPTSAGAIQMTSPSSPGQYIVACFIADTTTSGYYFNNEAVAYSNSLPFTWTNVTANTTMVANTGYFANGAGPMNFTLPATYAVGAEFQIVDQSGQGFTILQTLGGGSQQILDLGLASTAGTSGTTTTNVAGQSITLVAQAIAGALRVLTNKGTFTYA